MHLPRNGGPLGRGGRESRDCMNRGWVCGLAGSSAPWGSEISVGVGSEAKHNRRFFSIGCTNTGNKRSLYEVRNRNWRPQYRTTRVFIDPLILPCEHQRFFLRPRRRRRPATTLQHPSWRMKSRTFVFSAVIFMTAR